MSLLNVTSRGEASCVCSVVLEHAAPTAMIAMAARAQLQLMTPHTLDCRLVVTTQGCVSASVTDEPENGSGGALPRTPFLCEIPVSSGLTPIVPSAYTVLALAYSVFQVVF